MWVLDYLVDLESDFSRFHRVDDIYSMEGPRFFQMAWRISTYGGVMAMRVEEQQSAPSKPAVETKQQPKRTAKQDNKVVDLAAFMFSNPGLVERRKGVRGG